MFRVACMPACPPTTSRLCHAEPRHAGDYAARRGWTIAGDMLVLIRWQGRTLAVPLSQLPLSIPTTPPPKLSQTGIIGSQWATVFDLRKPAENSRN
jgi:hypothetical protein